MKNSLIGKSKMASITAELDVIASKFDHIDPRISLALDRISDKLEGRMASFKGGKYLIVRMEGNKPVEFAFSNTKDGISSIVKKPGAEKYLRGKSRGSYVISEVLNIIDDQKSWESFLEKGISRTWNSKLLVTTIRSGEIINVSDFEEADRLVDKVKQTHFENYVTVISGFMGTEKRASEDRVVSQHFGKICRN
jgi:hypothetical protein